MRGSRPSEGACSDRQRLGRELARQASAELARLARIGGPGRRTARRIARARARLALAAALLGAPLAMPSLARTPAFVTPPQLLGVGGFASPAFGDLDGDGDLDALVGSVFGETSFFANVGTPTAPEFAPPLRMPFGLTDVGSLASPALVDIDGDGDLDVFVGADTGDSIFFANTGGATTPDLAPGVANPFGLSNVGINAKPAFADVDGDGDLDAFIGENFGDTFFFENVGTSVAPAFVAGATNPFGLANLRYSAAPAFADLDGDGDLDAFPGNYDGDTVFFENVGDAGAPAFAAPETNPFGFRGLGRNAAPSFVDIDGDGDLDAFVGDAYGNVHFFENVTPLCPASPDPACREFSGGSLSVDERRPGREKLAARLSGGPALGQADFGDPSVAGGTVAALCVYDEAGARVALPEVDRAGEDCGARPCWKPLGGPAPGGKGFAYKDATGGADGVRSLKLKGGAAGRSSLSASAANRAQKGETALPTGIAAALTAATQVTVQLHTSDAGCFSATLSEIRQQAADRFRAR